MKLKKQKEKLFGLKNAVYKLNTILHCVDTVQIFVFALLCQ